MIEKIKENKKPFIIGLAILILVVLSVVFLGWIGLWYDLLLAAIVGIVLTDLKKHSLFKVMLILTLLIVITTNVLPSRQENIERIAIADTILNYFSIVFLALLIDYYYNRYKFWRWKT